MKHSRAQILMMVAALLLCFIPFSESHCHTDRLGTPQKLTARNGNTTWAAHYTAFGAATVNIEGVSNPLRLAGQYYDAESGLHQNLMRMYDPEIGAYLEQDPYGTLTGPNRYAFAGGNPVMLTDPTGEFIHVIVSGIIWLGFEAISGFPTIKCFDLLFQTCFFNSSMSDCIDAGTNALLGVGVGWAFKGLRLLAPAAGWALKFGRGFIDPVLPNLRRGTGLLDDLYKALPKGEADDALRNLMGRSDELAEIDKTLNRIKSGQSFPYKKDGSVFKNKEGRLPSGGKYREYTVDTPNLTNRGARRIVVDQSTGRKYYTRDHYDSFIDIGQ